MRMTVGRRSVSRNKLVIDLAEGRDVCVSRAHDADILLVSAPRPSRPFHDVTFDLAVPWLYRTASPVFVWSCPVMRSLCVATEDKT